MARRRTPLTRERILEAALDLVDLEGVEALTMRRLGRALGVEAMSLYSYVDSKDDLIEGVIEQVFRKMPLVEPAPGAWPDRLRQYASTYRQVLLDHPNTISLVARRPLTNEGITNFIRSALAELSALGLAPVTAERTLRVIASFTLGHVTEQLGDDARTRKAAEAEGLAPPGTDPAHDEAFALGMDFIVAGVDQLLSARAAPA
jgi:TetR/AcrR family transcriptional regulator, tetracycline repressor protein